MEVTIDLGPGLSIVLRGDLSSIGEAIQKLGNGQISSMRIQENAHVPSGNNTRLRGLKKEVLILRREGYFSEQRTSQEVTDEVNRRGMKSSFVSVSSCLGKLTKKKKFKRESFPAGPTGGRYHTFTSTYVPVIEKAEKAEKVQRKKRGEISGVFHELIEEGFFQDPRNKYEIKTECGLRGQEVTTSSLQSALQRAVRKGKLQKESIGGKGRGNLATYIIKKKSLFAS